MTDSKRLYADIHVLQTLPPSCVNRDDTGSPKTATYGGVRRARVSSQAWKHAMRLYFREEMLQVQPGVRTKQCVGMVKRELKAIQPNLSDEDAETRAMKVLDAALKKEKKGDGDKDGNAINEDKETKALLSISHSQISALARVASETDFDAIEAEKSNKGKGKKHTLYDALTNNAKNALKKEPSLDMILFGRMVAGAPKLNYDACAQVAHAISTHGVQTEYDYFTAVDDCAREDTSGAGHLGTVEFNSSTLYRYATVNLVELHKHAGADTGAAIAGFTKAFLLSMPTGKQNTFANRTLPSLAYVTLRGDQPVNLCGAFEKPVARGSDGGYMAGSIDALSTYAQQVYACYANQPETAWQVAASGRIEGAASVTMPELLEEIKRAANERLG